MVLGDARQAHQRTQSLHFPSSFINHSTIACCSSAQTPNTASSLSNCRRLPGCVVMGINRTRRLFGRQKKDAWAASQYTLYGFRPRCYHFLSPLLLFFCLWSRKLHFRYAHRYFLDIYGPRWNTQRNFPAVDFDWMTAAGA